MASATARHLGGVIRHADPTRRRNVVAFGSAGAWLWRAVNSAERGPAALKRYTPATLTGSPQGCGRCPYIQRQVTQPGARLALAPGILAEPPVPGTQPLWLARRAASPHAFMLGVPQERMLPVVKKATSIGRPSLVTP